MNKKILSLMIVGIFLLSLASVSAYPSHKQNEDYELSVSSNYGEECLLTYIKYPNGSQTIYNINLTQDGTTFYGTVDSGNFSQLGETCMNVKCEYGDKVQTDNECLEVTRTGKGFNDKDGGIAIAILVGVLAASFLFLGIGNYLSKNEKTIPLAMIFIFLAIVLVIYSLNLGWVYSHSIMEFDAIGNISQIIYTSFLWIIMGVVIISMALMLIAFIKHLVRVVERKQYGDDFNPITQLYE